MQELAHVEGSMGNWKVVVRRHRRACRRGSSTGLQDTALRDNALQDTARQHGIEDIGLDILAHHESVAPKAVQS